MSKWKTTISELYNEMLNAGVRPSHPDFLNNKIRLTNLMVLLDFLFIGAPFVVLTIIFLPIILPLPIAGTLIFPVCVALNSLGFHNSSRLVANIGLVVIGSIYNAAIVPAGAEPLVNTYMLQLAFCVFPFLLFDLSELRYLLICLAVSVFAMTNFDTYNAWIEIELDVEFIETGIIGQILYVLAVLMVFVTVGALSFLNKQAEGRSRKLVLETKKRQLELENSEKQLRGTMQQIEEKQAAEQLENWIIQGITKFGNIIRKSDDDDDLYQIIISELVKYIGAIQGAVYLVQEQEEYSHRPPQIDMVASYAYNKKWEQEISFRPGEGIVGEAYKEQQLIHLANIPKGYAVIGSGLGQVQGKELVVVPLIAKTTVEGFFELTTLGEYTERHIAFLKRLGEFMGASIANTKVNDHTKLLLSETQQQAEEMNAQEEEMRQNMEELAATQEEMNRKERSYLNRIRELEAEIRQLEG